MADQNSGWNAGNTGSTNPGDNVVTPAGFGTSSSSGSMGSPSSGTGSTSGFNVTSASDDAGTCAHCGQSLNKGGLEQFLGKIGITEEMIGNLKGQFQNVDVDEYLNTAREYLKDGGSKAQTYAKENPGKVAAGVAALALGAGLLYAAVNRDRT